MNELALPWMVIGGVAVIAAGVPRETFEEEALARASHTEVDGLLVPIALPEDLIVYKATAWRDRDRSDIQRLLVLHIDSIDIARVRVLIVDIATALDDPSRVAEFDALVARARRAKGASC